MRQRAIITKEVELVYGEVEDTPGDVPEMTLQDGSIEPAYFCERFVQEGTQGWAEFDSERKIWRFTPDAS